MQDHPEDRYVTALKWLLGCLDRYANANCSERGYLIEPIEDGHQIHEAVKAIEEILGSPLRRPMKVAWVRLLELSRCDDKDEDSLACKVETAADGFAELVKAEILKADAPQSGVPELSQFAAKAVILDGEKPFRPFDRSADAPGDWLFYRPSIVIGGCPDAATYLARAKQALDDFYTRSTKLYDLLFSHFSLGAGSNDRDFETAHKWSNFVQAAKELGELHWLEEVLGIVWLEIRTHAELIDWCRLQQNALWMRRRLCGLRTLAFTRQGNRFDDLILCDYARQLPRRLKDAPDSVTTELRSFMLFQQQVLPEEFRPIALRSRRVGLAVRSAWEYMRRLPGAKRPAEPERVRNTKAARRALDRVVKWCEQNTESGVVSVANAANRDRLHVEDVDSFARVRDVTPAMVATKMDRGFLDISEDAVQFALEQVLDVPFHKKDWGGEFCDAYTANAKVNGQRRTTAFLLKGPGIGKKEMTIADCGTNGDQLVRLFMLPADLFVIQYVGPISELLIADVQGKINELRSQGRDVHFLIIDGQDTARFLMAYDKL